MGGSAEHLKMCMKFSKNSVLSIDNLIVHILWVMQCTEFSDSLSKVIKKLSIEL